jgi:hypothetical protein
MYGRYVIVVAAARRAVQMTQSHFDILGSHGSTHDCMVLAAVFSGGPGNLSIPIRFYYRIRELNF